MRRRVAQLRLREDAAIDALLVRGVEVEDADALVLTHDDRRYASQAALAREPVADPPQPREAAAFLSRRAARALERLTARYPTLRRVRALSRWPAWLSWGVALGAFAVGATTNVLGGERLNIVAFPLLGMIAWNLAVYLITLFRMAFGSSHRSTPPAHPLLHSLEWVVRPTTARLAGNPTLERGVSRFASDWNQAAGRLTRARASRTLHVGAVMFALGILTGMFLRARYSAEYSAGWSGTWAGAEAEIALLLKLILGPASALTGIALPGVDRLRELRGAGENAGDWLILWGVTAVLVVIIPRLVLALVQGARAELLARNIAVPDDFYLRSLLRNALGRAGKARVVPYGFELSAETRERLTRLARSALGEKTVVHTDPGIPYGDEDEWLAREGHSLGNADQLIILFNLASTPEAENHGALVAGVRQRIGAAGTGLLVVLDDSSFRRKLRGQSSADSRIQERLETWKSVLAANAVTPATVTLDLADETASAQALEQALQRCSVLT
jgi:hypothetical protein